MTKTITLENSHGLAMDYVIADLPLDEQVHKLSMALTAALQWIEQEDTHCFGGAELAMRKRLLFQIGQALKSSGI